MRICSLFVSSNMEPLSTSAKNGSIDTGKKPNATRKKGCSKRRRPDVKKPVEESEKSDHNNGMSFEIDHKFLDCPLCHKPLRPPIFQCLNGHVACSLCHDKHKRVCQVCSLSIGCIRNRALESVIESIKVSCSYFRFGCRKTMSYTMKHIHKESCPYAPCYCPIQECPFHGTKQKLSVHFKARHRSKMQEICYGRLTLVLIRREDPFRVLRGEDGRLFLLIKGRNMPSGDSLSLACIQPCSLVLNLEYELEVTDGKGNEHCLKSSYIRGIKQWGGDHPTKRFLYVPHQFHQHRGCFAVFVKIQKIF